MVNSRKPLIFNTEPCNNPLGNTVSSGTELSAKPLFHLGDVIRKWREAKGWRNTDLADAAGIGKNTVSSIEDGQNTNTDTLERVVKALGHTVTELHAAVEVANPVTDEELTLLRAYRRLDEDHRAHVRDAGLASPPQVIPSRRVLTSLART